MVAEGSEDISLLKEEEKAAFPIESEWNIRPTAAGRSRHLAGHEAEKGSFVSSSLSLPFSYQKRRLLLDSPTSIPYSFLSSSSFSLVTFACYRQQSLFSPSRQEEPFLPPHPTFLTEDPDGIAFLSSWQLGLDRSKGHNLFLLATAPRV